MPWHLLPLLQAEGLPSGRWHARGELFHRHYISSSIICSFTNRYLLHNVLSITIIQVMIDGDEPLLFAPEQSSESTLRSLLLFECIFL